MNPAELGVWLTLGVLLAAPFLLLAPLRGGNGQHAHAGPGTLTVHQLGATAFQPPPDTDPDEDEITWPAEPEWDEPEPTPLERDLDHLLNPPAEETYVGRHRL